jgi:serine/threonine protein kinase
MAPAGPAVAQAAADPSYPPSLPAPPNLTPPPGGLSQAYDVKHLLGSGSAGDAWLCQERSTGDLVAVKLIKRPIPPLMGSSIMREVKIGAELGKGHLNIVKPREVVLTRWEEEGAVRGWG